MSKSSKQNKPLSWKSMADKCLFAHQGTALPRYETGKQRTYVALNASIPCEILDIVGDKDDATLLLPYFDIEEKGNCDIDTLRRISFREDAVFVSLLEKACPKTSITCSCSNGLLRRLKTILEEKRHLLVSNVIVSNMPEKEWVKSFYEVFTRPSPSRLIPTPEILYISPHIKLPPGTVYFLCAPEYLGVKAVAKENSIYRRAEAMAIFNETGIVKGCMS